MSLSGKWPRRAPRRLGLLLYFCYNLSHLKAAGWFLEISTEWSQTGMKWCIIKSAPPLVGMKHFYKAQTFHPFLLVGGPFSDISHFRIIIVFPHDYYMKFGWNREDRLPVAQIFIQYALRWPVLSYRQILWTGTSPYIVLTTLTSGPNLCMIAAENAAPANNRR